MQFVLLTLKKQKQRKSLISTQPIYHQPQTVEQAETSGLGILESLLSDANITDILVNGHKEVWVDQGNGLEKTKLTFLNEESVRSLAQKLALSTGRRLDQSQPYVDAQLTKTIRLHAVLSPIANPGTVISLRIHRPQILSLAELVINKTLTTSQKNFLTKIINENNVFNYLCHSNNIKNIQKLFSHFATHNLYNLTPEIISSLATVSNLLENNPTI